MSSAHSEVIFYFFLKEMIRIFLAYAKEDFEIVKQLYERLTKRGFEPWMDREKILGGQNWRSEIPKAIKKSHVFIPCFSSNSVSKQGYVQREFRMAMNEAAERPPGAIYIIPVRLNECDIPDLRQEEYGISILDWQWIDAFETNGFSRLVKAIENGFPDLVNKSNLVYCRRFQDAITYIAGKHGFDLHSESSGYVELKKGKYDLNLVISKEEKFVHVYHYYETNGDIIYDPKITFRVILSEEDGLREWVPISMTQPVGGYMDYRICINPSTIENDNIVIVDQPTHRDIAFFSEKWARALIANEWLSDSLLEKKEIYTVP